MALVEAKAIVRRCRSRGSSLRGAGLGLLALASACSGAIGGANVLEAPPDAPATSQGGGPGTGTGGAGGPSSPAACTPSQVVPRTISHLTRAFYNNTVRDLLGDTTRPADGFPLDDSLSGFEVGRDVSPRLARDWIAAAEAIAARAVGDLAKLVSCPQRNEACALTFIDEFLPRAFRRPPTRPEREDFVALFREGARTYDFATGLQLVIQTALSSPQFLYLAEPPPVALGEPVPPELDWAIASRLSYFLTGTMPDAELFAAARAGALHTTEQVRQQAERLVAKEGFEESTRDLANQWLGLSNLRRVEKPDGALSPAVAAVLEDSAFAFARHTLLERDSLEALLVDPTVFVNRDIAPYFGLSSTSATLEPVAADPAERAGILTHAGLLARLGKGLQPDPIHRGVFVRTAILCEVMIPPPDDIPPLPEGADLSDQVRAHAENPRCAGCHRLIDPVGFGFGNYDGLGRYRTRDSRGELISVAGVLEDVDDRSWPFSTVRELAGILSRSAAVQSCSVRRAFRHALRRAEQDADACALREAEQALRASGGSFRALMTSLAVSDAFLMQERAKGGGQR